jgi:hypothetical protein
MLEIRNKLVKAEPRPDSWEVVKDWASTREPTREEGACHSLGSRERIARERG